MGPAQAGLGGGACRDPEDGGGAGRRGTGNPLAKALGCPRASGGRDRAWWAPARRQARVGPKGCGLPGSRSRVASAPGQRAGRPRTSPGPGRGGWRRRARARPRHPARRRAPHAPGRARTPRESRVWSSGARLQACGPAPSPLVLSTPPRAWDSTLT